MAHGAVDDFSYPAARRLFGYAAYYWRELDGESARKGIDLLSYDFVRFLHAVLSWIRDHVEPDKWEQVEQDIFSATDVNGDPDRVAQSVVDEEMSLFAAFSRENRARGG